MRDFVALVAHLRALSGHPPAQAQAWARWQAQPPPGADLALAQRLIQGGPQAQPLPRVLTVQSLRKAPPSLPGWPPGLWQACLEATGDWLEALCLALPEPNVPRTLSLAEWCQGELPRIAALGDATARAAALCQALQALPTAQRLLAGELAIGRFRSPLVPEPVPAEAGAAAHRLAALCTYVRPASGGMQVALALWRDAAPTPAQWQQALAAEAGLAASAGPWVTIGQLPMRAATAQEQQVAQALKAAGTRRVGAVQAVTEPVVVWLRHAGAHPNARRKCGWELQGLQWDGVAEEGLLAVGTLGQLARQPAA